MVSGGVGCLALGAIRGESIPSSIPLEAGLAFVYLVGAGSRVAFPAYSYLLTNTRPAIATSYAYVNPVLAVALGIFVGAERPQPSALAAVVLVVSGVAVLATKRRQTSSALVRA
jgi:drug/metabolite transporter (DMT)-like permease